MKKFVVIGMAFFLIFCGIATVGMTVMLSHDTVYLYSWIFRIKDNSVIATSTSGRQTRFILCQEGVFDHMQTSAPETFTFIKTNNPNILNYRDWYQLNKDKADVEKKTHWEYLEEMAQDLAYSCEIVIPARENNKTYGAPQNGMTGGMIGSDRNFKIDIKKCKFK